MELYTIDSPLLLKDFRQVFQQHIRDKTERSDRITPKVGYKMYSEQPDIEQTYQKIHDIATIRGELPTDDILSDMGLMQLIEEQPCITCGTKIKTIRYVTVKNILLG